ncbi:MAG: RluA family pseudouridine synthase [Bacteroidota bacterium]
MRQEDYNEELFETLDIIVDGKQSPLRLDKFLFDRLQKSTRNRIQNAIKAGSIMVDARIVKPNHRVKPGQKISVVIPKPPGEESSLKPENIPLDIRYEDDDLLIVHKPPGMVVHPGIGHRNGTLVNALAYHLRDLDNVPTLPGNDQNRVGLVHRIDKDTSGLLVIAKNEYTMSHLARQFFDHTVDRSYVAIVWGEPEPTDGSIEADIMRHPRQRKQYTTTDEPGMGKWALTHYKTLEPLYYVSLIECRLETGRTHQIRVHMKSIGHTLFNDSNYGGDRILKGTVYTKYKSFVDKVFNMLPRQALHARSLGFIHPATGEHMFFESDLPKDMEDALTAFRHYTDAKRQMDRL